MPKIVPGARVAPLPPGLIARAGEAVRYVVSGVAPATWFGPMQPLKPLAPESVKGRAFDYPVGYNLRYQPRAEENVSFSMLHALADGCDLLRIVIETRKDQIEGQDWDVRPRKRSDGSHPAAGGFAAEIAAAKDFFAFPDREHDLSAWIRAIAEEMFVTDAVSIYLRPDRANRIHGFEILDGATIAPPNTDTQKLPEWQNYWNTILSGNVQERRHGIWVANGTDFKPLKPPQLTDPFDEFLARIVCFAFSISPQPFVSMMNRATAETAHDAALSEGLVPVLNYFRRLFRVLFDRMGWNDIEMVAVDDREIDPETAVEIDVADVQAGIRTVNEVRAARGLGPLPQNDCHGPAAA